MKKRRKNNGLNADLIALLASIREQIDDTFDDYDVEPDDDDNGNGDDDDGNDNGDDDDD
jgi:hypothetical protein